MKNIILLLFLLAFTSCATFKENSLNENRISLSENNLKKFEGTFKIVSKDTSERHLDASLLKYYSFRILYLRRCWCPHQRQKTQKNEKTTFFLRFIRPYCKPSL